MGNVKLIWITPNAESIMGYCARVSNPENQDNPDVSKLLKYCIDHRHWSVFETANMCLEIETSRAISAQILRHKSFSFQEFSQRYAESVKIESYLPRRQDTKNRQNSIDDLSDEDKRWWLQTETRIAMNGFNAYHNALERGISKETARFLLPMATSTRLYMNGTIRSWIHYITERTDKGAQKEHRDLAEQAKHIFITNLPIISEALEWAF